MYNMHAASQSPHAGLNRNRVKDDREDNADTRSNEGGGGTFVPSITK